MTGQHEPLWKTRGESGAPEG